MSLRRRVGMFLALTGIGIGMLSVAFTLSPPDNVPRPVFWVALSLGVLPIVVGLAMPFRGKDAISSESSPKEEMRDRRLLAAECRRVSGSLSEFVADWRQERPRARPFRDGESRMRRWRREGEERYQETFRVWALRVFDAAVDLDGVSPASRVFVDTPSHVHLHQLPDLFRDAARSLDPA